MKIIKTIGQIRNDNGAFDICVVDVNKRIWLATCDKKTDEFDFLETVKDISDAISKSNKRFGKQGGDDI